ncbi:hypothetical protein GW17_00048482 [Ensete ventricosum]|nr:hypothetical protein GW17_00048482 [Ensete ventricosum]
MLPCSSGEGRTIDLSTDADWCVPHLTMFIERRARVDFLGWFSLSVDALEARKVVTARVPRPKTSRPIANPAIEKHVPIEVRPPTKKLKRSGDSIGPIKEASPAPTPKPRPAPEVPRGDGSCRKKEKGVAHPWAMRDLCILSLPLAKEIYTTPSEVLVNDAAKNPVIVKYTTTLPWVLLIKCVISGVIDNLSQLNEELWADVRKLKDETRHVAIAVVEARANKATMKLDEAQHGEAEALEKVKALEKELQGLKGDLEAAQAKT